MQAKMVCTLQSADRCDSCGRCDKNWLWARSTLEFLGIWELMYDLKVVEFDHFEGGADGQSVLVEHLKPSRRYDPQKKFQ